MKLKIALIFGGKSSEHEVSLQSAKNIYEALDKEKYNITLIGIDKSGGWYLFNNDHFLVNADDPNKIEMNAKNATKIIGGNKDQSNPISFDILTFLHHFDSVFPVIHGKTGEDGSIQGLLNISEVPYVGTNLLSSAISMDKDITKILLQQVGIDVAASITVRKSDKIETNDYNRISKVLGETLFIKPANEGSSVGVSKITNKKEFKKALKEAFLYDNKVLIEEAIVGREIECAVLEKDGEILTSIPGEIVSPSGFYSYDEKYISDTTSIHIPAKLSEDEVERIQKESTKVFKTLECESLSRVDFFLTKEGRLVVNEINTMPGFTNISMYPKLWQESGISYSDLLNNIIDESIILFKKRKK